MLVSLMGYTAILELGRSPNVIIFSLGVVIHILTALLAMNLPHCDTELLEDEV